MSLVEGIGRLSGNGLAYSEPQAASSCSGGCGGNGCHRLVPATKRCFGRANPGLYCVIRISLIWMNGAMSV